MSSEAWTAAATVAVAVTAIVQIVFQLRRQHHESKPWLVMTGARTDQGGACRIEVCNLSTRPVAIDGLYADWNKRKPDGRLGFSAAGTSQPLSKHRTVLGPGEHLTRFHPFEVADQGDGNTPTAVEYVSTRAVLSVAFHYPSASQDLIRWRWRVELANDLLEVTRLE